MKSELTQDSDNAGDVGLVAARRDALQAGNHSGLGIPSLRFGHAYRF